MPIPQDINQACGVGVPSAPNSFELPTLKFTGNRFRKPITMNLKLLASLAPLTLGLAATTGYAADPSAVQRLKTSYECRKCDLTGADLKGANLKGANLEGANLTRINLSGANLSGANLTRAKLNRANLRGANLEGAILVKTDLRRADLRDANLARANLRGADLFRTDLGNANLQLTFYDTTTIFDGTFDPNARGMKKF